MSSCLRVAGDLAAVEEGTQRTLEWLVCVWHRLNDALLKFGLTEDLLGLATFLACPVDADDTTSVLQ